MAGRLRRFTRPGSHEEEIRVIYGTTHGCGGSDVPGDDCVVFPVGVYGHGFPHDSAFEVTAMEPCAACGTLLKIWSAWDGPTVFDMGAK